MKTSAEKLNVNFVKMVEANPCIWDNRSKDYRNKKMLKCAWHKISQALNEPVESCPDRWRKIRDALFRSIKRHSLKKNNRKRKPYYLTPYLHFLLPFSTFLPKYNYTPPEQDDKISLEYETETEDSKPGPFLNEIKTKNEDESFQNDNELESTSATMPPISEKRPNKNDTQEYRNNEHFFEMIDEAESALSKRRRKLNQEEEDETDSDMNFFKSLLRDVRKMNDRQNRKFRLRVLQVVEEIFDHNSGEGSFEQNHNCSLLRSHQRQKQK